MMEDEKWGDKFVHLVNHCNQLRYLWILFNLPELIHDVIGWQGWLKRNMN